MRRLNNMNLVKYYGYGALNNRNLELERFMKRPNTELTNQEREWKIKKGKKLLNSLKIRRQAARKIQSRVRKYIEIPKETRQRRRYMKVEEKAKEANRKGCFGGMCFFRRRKVVPLKNSGSNNRR
jgi:hypothetical protein